MYRKRRGLSTIVSEAIVLSIVVAWMGVIASLPNSIQELSSREQPPVLLPLYCSEKAVVTKVVKSGFVNILGNYSVYIVLQNITTMIAGGEYYLPSNALLLINSTKPFNGSVVLPTDSGFILSLIHI
jgi:hypothetical protein